jgi:hypothetical protein
VKSDYRFSLHFPASNGCPRAMFRGTTIIGSRSPDERILKIQQDICMKVISACMRTTASCSLAHSSLRPLSEEEGVARNKGFDR